MLVSFVYLCLRRVLGLIVALRRSEIDNNIEIAVLRHQVRVLERQLGRRVVYRRADRAWLGCVEPVVAAGSVGRVPGDTAYLDALASGTGAA